MPQLSTLAGEKAGGGEVSKRADLRDAQQIACGGSDTALRVAKVTTEKSTLRCSGHASYRQVTGFITADCSKTHRQRGPAAGTASRKTG